MQVPDTAAMMGLRESRRMGAVCPGRLSDTPLSRDAEIARRHYRCATAHDHATVLQLRCSGPGAVLILLRGSAADATRALDNAVAQDGYGALAHDHVAT